MDPLSDILSLLRPASYGFRGLDAGGDWALAFGPDDSIRCYAIRSGGCWLAVDGLDTPVRLAAGDFVLLSGGRPYRLYSAADAPRIDAFRFFPAVPAGETAVLNGGGDLLGVAGISVSRACTPGCSSACCRRSFTSAPKPARPRCAGRSNG